MESTLSIYSPEMECPLPSNGQLLTTETSHFSVDGASTRVLHCACYHIGIIFPPTPREAGKNSCCKLKDLIIPLRVSLFKAFYIKMLED